MTNKTLAVSSILMAIIGLIILFNIVGDTSTTVQSSFDANNFSNACEAGSCYWNSSATLQCSINSTNQTVACPNDITTYSSGTTSGANLFVVVFILGMLIFGVTALIKGTKK